MYRHGYGLLRHIVDRLEPAFADLLPPGPPLQVHQYVRVCRVEVCGRVVEGEVPVLADADEGYVERVVPHQGIHLLQRRRSAA